MDQYSEWRRAQSLGAHRPLLKRQIGPVGGKHGYCTESHCNGRQKHHWTIDRADPGNPCGPATTARNAAKWPIRSGQPRQRFENASLESRAEERSLRGKQNRRAGPNHMAPARRRFDWGSGFHGHPASEPFTAEAQTSWWIRSATLARPSSGFFHVKASGIDAFFLAMNSLRELSMAGSR